MNTYFLVTVVNSHQRSDIKEATSQSQWSSSLLKKGWGPLSDLLVDIGKGIGPHQNFAQVTPVDQVTIVW